MSRSSRSLIRHLHKAAVQATTIAPTAKAQATKRLRRWSRLRVPLQ